MKNNNVYTKRQIADWRSYEKVRQSRQWNMWDEAAQRASGLRRDDYLFVMKNYSNLKDLAKEEKKTR